MSTIYYYYVGSPVNIASSANELDYKITMDLDISSTYVSTVYNPVSENVEITFSASLDAFQINVLNSLTNLILYGGTTGVSVYNMDANKFNRRSFGVTGAPSINSDTMSGYSVGSIVTTKDNNIYFCTNNTESNSVWEQVVCVGGTGYSGITGPTGPTGNVQQDIFFNSGGNISSSVFLRNGSSAALVDQQGAQLLMGKTGTIQNMHVYLSNSPGGTGTWTFTVYNGSTGTILSTQITGSGTTGMNITDGVSVVPFDLISVAAVSGGTVTPAIMAVTITLTS